MKKYKKKPVVIEAMQITDEASVHAIIKWMNSATVGWQTNPPIIWIDTLEGRMTAEQGSYIIKGVHGEFYPCKGNIFEITYEEV